MSATTQQELFPNPETPQARPALDHEPAPVWLQRFSLVVLVFFCLLVGVVVIVLPWSPRVWDHNGWLLAHPQLFAVLRQGWMRGIISGLGLIDIWIGIAEAVHYRDYRP